MNLLDLVTHLRVSILDDVGGLGVEWSDLTEDDADSAQLRWSNEELTRFINEAQNMACRAAFLLKKNETAFDIAVTAGTADYTLDSRIIRVKSIESTLQGKSLLKSEIEDFEGIRNWRTKEATPEQYIIDESNNDIKLYPIPIVDDTLTIIYYRIPLVQFDWSSNTVDSELRLEYQVPMLDYAAYLAYMKDEANTLDPTRAGAYKQLFTQNFTDTSIYGEVRRKRSRNRTVRYRDVL